MYHDKIDCITNKVSCTGMKYAMMSMKVVLATLIRTFVFKVKQKVSIDNIKLTICKLILFIYLKIWLNIIKI